MLWWHWLNIDIFPSRRRTRESRKPGTTVSEVKQMKRRGGFTEGSCFASFSLQLNVVSTENCFSVILQKTMTLLTYLMLMYCQTVFVVFISRLCKRLLSAHLIENRLNKTEATGTRRGLEVKASPLCTYTA